MKSRKFSPRISVENIGCHTKCFSIFYAQAVDMAYFTYVEPGPTPEEGTWSVTLDPVSAGGPYTIHVYGRDVEINITDVMFGDVWVCSGQSNMQFTVSQVTGHYSAVCIEHMTVNRKMLSIFVRFTFQCVCE